MPGKRRPVYESLKSNIVNGSYGFGAALDVRKLETEHLVSSIPIREALIALSCEGLVDLVPGRGFSTTPLDLIALSHHLDMITLVLTDAAFYICSLDLRREKVVTTLSKWPEVSTMSRLSAYEQADLLARTIHEVYRNPHMLVLQRSLFRCAPAFAADVDAHTTFVAVHAYFDAIAANSPAAAKRATRWFIARQKKRLPKMLEWVEAKAA